MSLLLLLSTALAQPLVAIVVVDQEARESGYALEIDGWLVDAALPVDVAHGETLVLVEPDGDTEPLDVAPGEAWQIAGPDGRAWMAELDTEVRTDVLLVRGEESAIAALAESLGAEVVQEGEQTWLVGNRVLLDAPWVDDPGSLALDEVSFVRIEDEAPLRTQPAAEGVTFRPSAERARTHVAREAAAARPTPRAVPTEDPVAAEGAVTQAPSPSAPQLRESSLDFGTEDEERARYAGLHLCADDMLWLHPAGIYSLRGVTGTWSVGAPGVIRMRTSEGDVLFRAAIDPDTGFCRDVWTPEETGEAMPEGYERFTTKRKRPKFD